MQQRKVTFPVSRSLWAAAKCLLVSHPNGTISLYRHLDAFSPKVAAYVEQGNTAGKVSGFLDCPPEMFPVQKANRLEKQAIRAIRAVPLHFEIRYRTHFMTMAWLQPTCSNHSVYKLEDALPPEFRMVLFYGYSTSDDGIPVTRLITGFDGNNKQAAVNVRTPSLWR